MSIWELLGIAPTTDIDKIKSAYARQAKLYHPEEHPEEFTALQNAYKSAVRMAKRRDITAAIPPMPAEASMVPPMPAEAPVVSSMPAEAPEVLPQPQAERIFDFSGIDVYGDKEHFFKQFLLIAKNPYLRNNLIAWDYYLNRKDFEHLFHDTDFRMEFVRTMCKLPGWRRKTVLFFDKYLKQYHTDENRPDDGKWETSLRCFFIRKLPWPRLPAFCTDRFCTQEGKNFQRKIHSQISRSLGRELDYEMRSDLIKYMKLYLPYAESKEDCIERIHSAWKFQRLVLWGLVFVFWLIMAISAVRFTEQKRETAKGMAYLGKLYGSEWENYTKEQKEALWAEYNYDWKYAKEQIDDAMQRYEAWIMYVREERYSLFSR